MPGTRQSSLYSAKALFPLFDSGASHSFISPAFAFKFMQKTYTVEGEGYCIRATSGTIPTKLVVGDVQLEIEG